MVVVVVVLVAKVVVLVIVVVRVECNKIFFSVDFGRVYVDVKN